MFEFVLQKIISKKWMILSLLIGNILLVGLVASNPIYSEAILQKTLDSNLSDYLTEENTYPGNVTVSAKITASSKDSFSYISYVEEIVNSTSEELGAEELNLITEMRARFMELDLENGDGETAEISFGYMSDIAEHSEILYGEMFSEDGYEEDGSIGLIVSESMLANNGLLLGESYTVNSLKDENGDNLVVTIKGVFTNSDVDDTYWIKSPSSYSFYAFMNETVFYDLFFGETMTTKNIYATYTVQVDYTQFDTTDVDEMLDVIYKYQNIFDDDGSYSYEAEFTEIFEEHLVQENELNVTLLVLQVPIFILLATFIYMVSSQILELEQSEIAIFKSRGASKGQIISIYLIQSGMISFISLLVGLPLGYMICQILGSSNAFLEFVSRTSLPAVINGKAVIYSLIAVLFSIITMVVPVLKHSNIGIVTAKRKKQERFNLKLWEKLCIDFIFIGVALYGLYTTNSQIDLITEKALNGEAVDPIIFLYSSIFIIGMALLALRIFPWIMKLIFMMGKKSWSPATYLSFKRVISGNDKQGFIMVFLILTISIGVFNSVTARTINSNEQDSISYNNGADIILQEVWDDGSSDDTSASTDYTEPNYAIYSEIEGVESYTKVYTADDISVSLDDIKLSNVTLMAIQTNTFGETAWFDTDLLPYHWYEYLNAISQNPEAILMSSNAKEDGGLEVGDTISYYSSSTGEYVKATIYGFVDYWPTYNSVVSGTSSDGTTTELNQYLIIANLSQVQAELGILPYQIWINVEDSTAPVYEFIEENGIELTTFIDTQADIIEQKNDPLFQGTNGVLTVVFITVLTICTVGFLIYWILSIISRQLQFGIYRAMGMSMKEILLMLGNEQLCVSGYGILIGTGVGIIASILYVPLIEITYAQADRAIPLDIVFSMSDGIKIFVVIGLMIAVCMTVLSVMISKLKITQVLKLGED